MLCVVQALGIAMNLLQTVACPVNDMTLALLVTLRKHAMAGICALPAGHAAEVAVRAGQCDACPGNSGSKLRQASVRSRLAISRRGGGACRHLGAAMRGPRSAQARWQPARGCRWCWATSRVCGLYRLRASQLISLVWGSEAALYAAF